MKHLIAAIALAATLAQPTSAVTFPALTTIYVGSGVYGSGDVDNTGEATSIHCSNVSGVTVQVRALVLGRTGSVEGSLTVSLAHGQTVTFSTNQTAVFADESTDLEINFVRQGVVNIEATNSAVFCTAVVVDAENDKPVYMSPLHLVRVNPHPGTVE
jgi:hypothetical protein